MIVCVLHVFVFVFVCESRVVCASLIVCVLLCFVCLSPHLCCVHHMVSKSIPYVDFLRDGAKCFFILSKLFCLLLQA